MADRRASVALELKASAFKAEAKAVEASVEGVDRKVEKLDRDITKIPPDAAKAGAALKLLGDESGKAGAKLDDLGKSSTSMGLIDQRIIHTRGELRRLAEEFDRTGDAGVLQKLFKGGDELKDLERLKKQLVSWGADAGKRSGEELIKSLGGTISTGSVPGGLGLTVLITGAVAAALPVINGLLLGAAGLGGIGLGIAGQFRDPQVKAAIGDVGQTLMGELQRDTMAFRDPLIAAAGLFGVAVGKALHSIDFGQLAKLLVPLATGLGGMIQNSMPGFNQALRASEPIIRDLRRELPELGSAASQMWAEIAKGSQGGQEAMRGSFSAMDGFMVGLGWTIGHLSGVYHQVIVVDDSIAHFGNTILHNIPIVGAVSDKTKEYLDHIRYGSHDVDMFTKAVNKSLHDITDTSFMTLDHLKAVRDAWKDVDAGLTLVTQTATKLPVVLDAVGHAMHGTAIGMVGDLDQVDITANQMTGQLEQQVFGAIMGVAQANIAWHRSLLDVTEAVKQNGTTLKDNTKEGLANQLAILGMVQANQQVYQANIASGMSADDARQKYEQNHDQMVKSTIAAGFNAQSVHGLTDAYRAVPATAQTEIIAKGLRSVLDAINDLIWQLALLNGKSATIDVYYKTHGMPPPTSGDSMLNVMAHGGIRKAAMGMFIPPSDPGTVLVGEPQTGGEVLIPMRGASNPVGLMRTAGAGYGLDVVPRGWGWGGGGRTSVTNVTVNVNAGMGTDGYQVGRQVADALRPYVERSGGSVQQAVMRRA